MTNPEYVEPDERGAATWKDVLVRDRWRLIGVLLVAVGLYVYFGYEIEIPRPVRAFAVVATIGAALGYAPASRLVAWIFSPQYTYLVDLESRTDDLAIWELPPSWWKDLEVREEELHPLKATAPAWFCKDYDPEENACNGTWMGSATDLELVEERERIDEIREVLEDLAKEGLTLRVKQSGIIRTAIRGIVMSFVEGFEKETIYDGEEIDKAIDKALERWKLDPDRDDPDGPPVGDDGSQTEPNVGKPRKAGLEPMNNGGDTDD